MWNDEGHQNDYYGSKLRAVKKNSKVIAERGVTHVIIDTTKYNSSNVFEFNVMQE